MAQDEIKVRSRVKVPGGREGVVQRIEYNMVLVWERRPPKTRGDSTTRWYDIDELTYLGDEPNIAWMEEQGESNASS